MSDDFSIVEIAQMDSRWLRELGHVWIATTIDGLLAELRATEADLGVAVQVAAERADEAKKTRQAIDAYVTANAALHSELRELRDGNYRLLAERQAVLDLLSESCREWIGDNRCGKPSEFILWGKLFSADALGPRCYDHAAHHVGASSLSYRQVEQSAIFDLRRIRSALGVGAATGTKGDTDA